MEKITTENELLVESAFTRQSVIFDQIYQDNTIISYKRGRVRDHILRYVNAGGQLLELNSGTGEDALFFAKKGFSVHATDISVGMQAELRKKVVDNGQEVRISQETCSFTQLELLENKGPYDLIYSNFAGLNCTAALGTVLSSFDGLLKDEGIVSLVILPKFCLWETLLVFKGKFKTAFRRFFSENGQDSHLEGVHFKCWYYQPSFIKKHLKADFEVLAIEGLCTIVPPSYIENFAEKYPRVYRVLLKLENRLKGSWPWCSIGDYYIISLKRKPKLR
jgi:ubiquinone/menaquinone biosynthesis C-methylase UbiE